MTAPAMRSTAPGMRRVTLRRLLVSLHAARSWFDGHWSRGLVVLGVVASFACLALTRSTQSDPSSLARRRLARLDANLELELSPVPSTPSHCTARGEQALARAHLLEQRTAAAWERVPFEPRELPRAVAQIAEAEACFAAAHDRTSRMRAAALHGRYTADLERRVARARLLLRVALRAEETQERSNSASDDSVSAGLVPRQLAVLLALFERAPPSAHAYRSELEQLARRYGAESPTTTTSTERYR